MSNKLSARFSYNAFVYNFLFHMFQTPFVGFLFSFCILGVGVMCSDRGVISIDLPLHSCVRLMAVEGQDRSCRALLNCPRKQPTRLGLPLRQTPPE